MSEMSDDEIDWRLDRLPIIKRELEEHGMTAVPKRDIEVSRGIISCLFWLGVMLGGPMIGAGLTDNRMLGAGVGILIVMVLMTVTQGYYDAKKSRTKN